MIVNCESLKLPETIVGGKNGIVKQFNRIGSSALQNLTLPQTFFSKQTRFRQVVTPLQPYGMFGWYGYVELAKDMPITHRVLENADNRVKRWVGVKRRVVVQANTDSVQAAVQTDEPINAGDVDAIAENIGNRPG